MWTAEVGGGGEAVEGINVSNCKPDVCIISSGQAGVRRVVDS